MFDQKKFSLKMASKETYMYVAPPPDPTPRFLHAWNAASLPST